MKFWTKRASEGPLPRSVARAASAGAPRQEWMREAVHKIAQSVEVDRIGVWLEADTAGDAPGPWEFRGLVWDRHLPETPREWWQLSPEPPLPRELVTATGSVELDPQASAAQAVLGPLLDLRRALWVPIHTQHCLRGLLLAGTKQRSSLIPSAPVEHVAAELAIALERDEARQRDQHSQADARLIRSALRSLNSGDPPEVLLQRLAESCIPSAANPAAPGAVFAALGVLENARTASSGASSPAPTCRFLWTAGTQVDASALQGSPLLQSWRDAVENRRVAGIDLCEVPSLAQTGRAVALPVASGGAVVGVLFAILPAALATLATLERLELRASLAAQAFARKIEAEERARLGTVQRFGLTASRYPALLIDSHGLVMGFSRAAADLFLAQGSPHASAGNTGRPLTQFFRPSEQPRVVGWLQRQIASSLMVQNASPSEAFEAQLQTGRRIRLQRLLPAADGSLVLLAEGLPETAQATGAAETDLHQVIEWLEEGVVLFDTQDSVRAMNMRFEQMVGLTAEESGKYHTLDQLIERLAPHSAHPPAFAERWRSLARGTEGGVHEELQIAQPVPRTLERSSRPILDSAGHRLGRLEIYRDLTAQRVFQSKLLQTEKLAALGQMLTGVAHELSNPVTTILGYAQRMLARTGGTPPEEAQRIHEEAERARQILRQLLSHAREAPLERRALSLNQVVLRTMELQRFGLAAEKIHVELDLDPSLPAVRGDAGQLQQVLMNLIGNARQAIEQQGSRGTIHIRTGREGQDRVTLSVEDSGPGVPPAILARVFDPFFTTKPAGVGTGLGLSIVLSIVREHGGSVRVSRPDAGGACFTVDLPAVATEANASQEPESLEPGRSRPTSAKVRASSIKAIDKRILVVEDEPTVARLIADVLEDEGFQVTVLLDGREALEHAAGESFDLIICDVKMPGLDGQQFYKALKRARSPLSSRFLFVTGDTIGPHTREFLNQNRLPYLSKPFRVEELTDHVQRALRHPDGILRPVSTKRSAARNG